MLPLWIQHLFFEYPPSASDATTVAAASPNGIGTLSATSASSFLANDNLNFNDGLRSLPGSLLD